MEVNDSPFSKYCRFCAEEKDIGDVHNLTLETAMFIEIREIVSSLNLICVDFSVPLPNTCCKCCFDKLKNSHNFFMLVRDSQVFLRNLFIPTHAQLNPSIKQEPKSTNYEFDIKKEGADTIDLSYAYSYLETELLVPSTSSDYHESPIINNNKNLLSSNQKTDNLDNSSNKANKEEYRKKIEHDSDETIKSSLQEENSQASCSDANEQMEFDKKIKTQTSYCDICDRHFKDRKSCYYHMKSHIKSKKFNTPLRILKPKGVPLTPEDVTCDDCGKVFQTKAYLAVHKQSYCPNTPRNKEAICDFCGKAFFSKLHLYNHRIRHISENSEIPLHQCQVCEKTFPTFRQLKLHVSVHTGEKPYTCSDCGQKFRLQHQLHNHRKNTHTTEEKPFECEVCHKRFRLKKTYNNHQLQHTGVKPYSCDHCEKSFVDWSNYSKHTIRKHNIDIRKNKRQKTEDQANQDWVESVKNKPHKPKGRRRVSTGPSTDLELSTKAEMSMKVEGIVEELFNQVQNS